MKQSLELTSKSSDSMILKISQLKSKSNTAIAQIFTKANLKCPYGRKGLQFCTTCNDSECILCSEEDCQCLERHENCYVQKIKSIERYITKKIVQAGCSSQIKENVKKIVDQVSLMEKSLLQHFDSKIFGLTEMDYQFLEKVKNYSQCKGIPGASIPKYKQQSQDRKGIFFQSQMKQKLQLVQNTQTTCNSLFRVIQQKIIGQYRNLNFNKNHFNNSHILRSFQQKAKLSQYFNHIQKPIVNLSKVYSAANEGWSSQTFIEKCQNKPNLLYLVQNEFGKKYGGYSPCKLSSNRPNKWQTDQSHTSFIFSLDADLKALLVQSEKAINNAGQFKQFSWFVSFGGVDNCNLFIGQKCNKKPKSNWINFSGGAYEKKQYQILEVTGTEKDKYRLKQFQVFQLSFAQRT